MTTKFEKLIIAEIGSVHDGSFGNALKLIELACHVGANAVKFQTHIANAETTRYAPTPSYFQSEPRFDYFERTQFSLDQWRTLKRHANSMGMLFCSSPFSSEAVSILDRVGIDLIKIASGEVTNLPMLSYISELNYPILLSSGMSSYEEIGNALTALGTKNEICLMQCTSSYPTNNNEIGLNILDEFRVRFPPPVVLGYSCHSSQIFAPIAAAALGAQVIEKHLTFSRAMYGSDAQFALEPCEFKKMTEGIRAVWTMLENPVEKSSENFHQMKMTFEKSIVARVDIKEGEILTSNNLTVKKPGDGVGASYFNQFLHKVSNRSIKADEQLKWSDINE
jgi:N-acetylneuraminate synthase